MEEPTAGWAGWDAGTLASRWGVPAVHAFRRVGSTSDVARRLARDGAPAGTVVVAEEQLTGRGRSGRGWSSPPGLGLWLSIVARPADLRHPGLLPLLLGVEAAAVLDGFLRPGAVRLKWPNDLLVAGRKLGGILCEAAWSGDSPLFLVAGVGVNILHRQEDYPAELRPRAISLRMAGAADASPGTVADRLVPAMYARLRAPPALTEADRAALDARDALRGREITISDPASGAPLGAGWGEGIAPDGALRVRDYSGRVESFLSGTIRFSNATTTDDELRDFRRD